MWALNDSIFTRQNHSNVTIRTRKTRRFALAAKPLRALAFQVVQLASQVIGFSTVDGDGSKK